MSIDGFKIKIQNNVVLRKPYYALKKIKDKKIEENQFKFQGLVRNRSKKSDKLCIILAGYKEYLYEDVFVRIETFAPKSIDVCVVTSGLYSEKIDILCKKNEWTYISTKENNVCLVQNVAIREHPTAKYIFKLDEDIFITKDFFENMLNALEESKKGIYNPGVIAPLIPVNGYGHVRILDKLGMSDKYKDLFEKPIIAAGPGRMIENNPEVAMFFWGKGGYIPSIDRMNDMFSKECRVMNPCAIRFSIGAILFERKLIEDMGYFAVERATTGMAQDEIELCSFCCLKSRPIIVTENVVVGHFSFGPQTKDMKEFYLNNRENFRIEK